MSVKIMNAVWLVDIPHADKIVLLALADNANDDGYCYPSTTTLATKCGMAERSVRRVLARLESAGQITIHERPGRSCTFDVHPGPTVRGTPDPQSPPPRTESPTHPGPSVRTPRTFRPTTPDFPSDTPDRGSADPGPSVPHNHHRTIKEPLREPSRNPHARARTAGDTERFERLKAAYPLGTYRQSEWLLAEREIERRISEGHTWQDLHEGVERYVRQCEAKSSIGTQFVLSPSKFFASGPAPPFLEPFPLPATTTLKPAKERWRPPDEPAAGSA